MIIARFGKMAEIAVWCHLLLSAGVQSQVSTSTHPLRMEADDRIVFLGNAFFEQAIFYGELETSLALRLPEKKLSFRNIGWSGDTVFGHSRTFGRRGRKFGGPEAGFERMIQHLTELGPDIVFVAYGFNESFENEKGLGNFRQGLLHLLDRLDELGAEVVLLSPTPMEGDFGASAKYVEDRNVHLLLYGEEMRDVSDLRGLLYIDLFRPLKSWPESYSRDGIHPSANGYRRIAEIMVESLGLPEPVVRLDSDEASRIRSEIIEKNQLYFHRWRPRNDAFVYGERRDEQRIAQVEPDKIKPFIEKKELLIRNLLEEAQ